MVGAVLDAFRPAASPASSSSSSLAYSGPGAAAVAAPSGAAAAATFFRMRSTAAQHHALALLGRILHVDPTAIHAMRGAALWELAYGPAFFFFGQVRCFICPHVDASNIYL